MSTSMQKRAYTVPALLLCLALLAGCAAPAAVSPETTASPTPPSTVPDTPAPAAEPTLPAAEKNGMYDLLSELFDRYHAGTAGSSLTAAYLAATMVDWYADNGHDAALSGALAWDRGMETEFGERLGDKLEAARESALRLARGETGILRDCGYEGSWEHSELEVAETFDTLALGLGLEETDGAETEERSGAEGGTVILRTETERETYYGSRQEDREILYYACTRPSVSIPGNTAAQDAVNALLEADWRDFVYGPEEPQEGLTAGRDNFLQAAEEHLEMSLADGYDFNPFELERRVDVSRGDDTVLSLIYADTTYMNGAHGYTLCTGHSYDVRRGTELHLEDLGVNGGEFVAALEPLLLQVAEDAEYGIYAYWENYREILPTLLRDDNWYLSSDGLVVLANPYEMDCYAAGLISFTIPYAWLSGSMKAEYLPSDSLPQGELSGEILPAAGESSYLLDDGTDGAGAAVTFTAHGRVEDLSLRRVSYSEYSQTFWSEELYWHAGALNDGETLTLLTWIPDVVPNLAISYTGARGPETFYIAQSGKDGSLVLMPESDFAALPREISGLLPYSIDLNGDGEKETLDLRSTGANGGRERELLINGSVVPTGSYALDGDLIRLWLTDLDNDGTAEIFFTGDMGSDDYVTCGWRGDTLEPIFFAGDTRNGRDGGKTDTADGELCFSLGTPVLRSWVYQMGTYAAFRPYVWEDGQLIPAPYSEWNYRSNTFELELIRDLPVQWYSGEEGVLPAGSRLILRSSDGNQTRFVTPDGSGGSITLEYRQDGMNSGWFISGISENEYFTFLPYAG